MNGIAKLLTAGSRDVGGESDDAELLARFVADRDATAFEVLVWRYAGLVRGIARRYLPDPNDIDDATQGAFLALARKARSVRAVGPWIAQVTAHAARRLRRANGVRTARQVPFPADVPGPEVPFADGGCRVLAEEVALLPEDYRAVVRRCYLDGQTASEAARELGWARGTVLTRLAWARARLRQRLTSRGVTLGAGVSGLLYQLAAGPVTWAAVRDIGRAVVGTPGARVCQLTDGALSAMFWTKVKFAAGVALAFGAALVGTAAATSGRPDSRPLAATVPASVASQFVRPATGAPDLEAAPAPRELDGPIRVKPGAGPGFGWGFGDGATPLPSKPKTPAKVKPGVGPGSGSGGGDGATPLPVPPSRPAKVKPGVGPGMGGGD